MYDTFISYRRAGGKEVATRLFDYLNSCGFDVFLDLSEMEAGRFDEQIQSRIENAENFILILSPSALDRCSEEGDWVCREIETALRLNKYIITFQAENFVYPKNLPEQIKNIQLYQAVFYHDGTMRAQAERVAGMLRKPVEYYEASGNNGNIRKRIKFSGEYITEYEDIEMKRTVIRKAPATLRQIGNKIYGTTAFSVDKQWKIQARVYNKKQIAGVYYAMGYLDEGFGTFFLEAKSPSYLEGFWSGYDSVAKMVTSGRYVFKRKFDNYTVREATPQDFSSIIQIAAAQLGENYVTREYLEKMPKTSSKCVVAVKKNTKKVFGFCIVAIVDYDYVMGLTGNKGIMALRGERNIGYVKTIAVDKRYAGKGIGTDLLKKGMKILKDQGAECYFTTAWKHAGIVNIQSLVEREGFTKNFELKDYWYESSVREGFTCPHCGNPCHCSCVFYTKI